MNIYVGNVAHASTEEGLKNLFEQFGTVVSARVIKDKMTGRSRGFAFVEMSTDDEAKAAIEGLNGTQFDGRTLRVSEAQQREERRPGGGMGGGNNRSRGGYNRGGFDRGGYDRGGNGGGRGRF